MNSEMRSVTPDDCHGLLGGFCRAALASHPQGPKTPVLYLAVNVMPDPPFPAPMFIPMQENEEMWFGLGQDQRTYLTTIAQALRHAPTAPAESFSPEHHKLAQITRMDAIAWVFHSHMVIPDQEPSGQALLANIAEGFYREGDVAASPAAQDTVVSTAVDRDGNSVMMWAPTSRDGQPSSPTCPPGTLRWPLLDVLSEILAAQYDWTVKTFGEPTGIPGS